MSYALSKKNLEFQEERWSLFVDAEKKKLLEMNTTWKSLLWTYPFQEGSGLTLEQDRGLQMSISILRGPYCKLSRSKEL